MTTPIPERVEHPRPGDLGLIDALVAWPGVTPVPPTGWTLVFSGPDPESGGVRAVMHRVVTEGMSSLVEVVFWSNGEQTVERPAFFRHTEASLEVERLEGLFARSPDE